MKAVHVTGCNICQAHICECVVSECEQLCEWLAEAQRELETYRAEHEGCIAVWRAECTTVHAERDAALARADSAERELAASRSLFLANTSAIDYDKCLSLASKRDAAERELAEARETLWEISTLPCRRAKFVDGEPTAKFCPDYTIPRVIWCPSCIARAGSAREAKPEGEKKGEDRGDR